MNSTGSAKLTLELAGSIYAGFMEEIKIRLRAIGSSLGKVREAGSDQSYLDLEFCYLQIRMICELIALAVLSAHNEFEEAQTKSLLNRWNADDIFGRLEKLNPDCFPTPRVILPNPAGDGIHLDRIEGAYLRRSDLKRIYHSCGDKLHRGVLDHIYRGKRKVYNPAQIGKWALWIQRLLTVHLVFLPDRKGLLLIQMQAQPGNVQWTYVQTQDGGE